MDPVGTCMTMCPQTEFIFRKQHKLLHVLELSSHDGAIAYKKTTIYNCVKEFHRSAAGESICELENLRPSSVLLDTTSYLLENILKHSEVSFVVKYDFVFDRLRSIRQDSVIQRLERNDPVTYAILMERCVRFYMYAAYQCQLDSQLKIDTHINYMHINDCLKSLFQFYSARVQTLQKGCIRDCIAISAAYVLLNLDSSEILSSLLKSYPMWLRNLPEISLVKEMYFSYQNKNFICFNKAVFKLIKMNIFLPLFALTIRFSQIRANILIVLCHSHNSKHFFFPSADLCPWLLLKNSGDVLACCKKFNLSIVNDTFIKFSKEHKKPLLIPNCFSGCYLIDALEKLVGSQELYIYLKKG